MWTNLKRLEIKNQRILFIKIVSADLDWSITTFFKWRKGSPMSKKWLVCLSGGRSTWKHYTGKTGKWMGLVNHEIGEFRGVFSGIYEDRVRNKGAWQNKDILKVFFRKVKMYSKEHFETIKVCSRVLSNTLPYFMESEISQEDNF